MRKREEYIHCTKTGMVYRRGRRRKNERESTLYQNWDEYTLYQNWDGVPEG